ncbi:unnamed protein product [Cyprideis torosa]|uniref:Uncharacterized protein n=1 Tax=Cyprideis torosa TaxID=163714 RepID=A0A7R8WG49_9CRUS|nr:unnamed protein product [Cyprideis torosa]CAG0896158.1 unnamed protein product [Cyprideis torosa]
MDRLRSSEASLFSIGRGGLSFNSLERGAWIRRYFAGSLQEFKGVPRERRMTVVVGLVVTLVLVVLIVTLASRGPSPYTLLSFGGASDVAAATFPHAAIASDAPLCAAMAKDMMQRPNATTMDGMITGLLCDGVMSPHNMGLGGGFFMVVYNQSEGRAYALDAREAAPLGATRDMFTGTPESSTRGGLAIAVPGELRGYQMAHQRVPQRLLKSMQQNSIFPIDPQDLEEYAARWEEPIRVRLGDILFFSSPPPASGALLGFILNIMDEYKLTPDSVRSESDELLLWHRFVEALKWAYAKRTALGDPADPSIRKAVLGLTKGLASEALAQETRKKISDEKTSQTAQDYGAIYASEPSHGTSQLSMVGVDGLAISTTSTINLYFGSKVVSQSTGIVFNNQMDDFGSPNVTNFFGLPPSPANFIAPGKRPLSSSAPAVFVDVETNRTRLVLGAAGGTAITSAVAYVALRHFWLGQNLKASVESRRIHHQLTPMDLFVADDVPEVLKAFLEAKGHKLRKYPKSSVTGVAAENGGFTAMYDPSKPGQVDGF